MIENLRGYWAFRVVDRFRLEDPRRTLKLAKHAVRRADERLLPWILNSCGSALRRLGHFSAALEVFVMAADLARAQGDRRGLATIRLQLSHVFSDLGDNQSALRYSYPALLAAVQDVNSVETGRSLVVLGKWFYHLDKFDESLRCNQAALRLLPKSEANLRFGALLGKAYCYEELGDLDAADRWSGIAERNRKGVRPAMLASLLLHWGELAMRRGRYDVGVDRFGAAYEFYVGRGFYFLAAITAVELCDCLTRTGNHKAAIGTARATVRLVDHLNGSPYVQGLLGELIRQTAAGRPLTLRFLADLRERLKRAEMR